MSRYNYANCKDEVEVVYVNNFRMYRAHGQLFLRKTDATYYTMHRKTFESDQARHAKNGQMHIDAGRFRTVPANYEALSFGYSEADDEYFEKMLKNGSIKGMLL